ncbi:MAG TPA: glycosyltransferase family 2 protein [Saprospiraceae bacterium]|jgi:glycosyltransferase involved in cell wall biosynthesis|nr:glycosyltransferase family 2 protein [Saprospiraceae bacterium]MCC6689468.1 glycosyltransferase family 2 protein [Saprospiraceae bacterium]HMW74538.1 glycosyltransferase family 2 protein [Saprospiraceae bacterium]HMX82593.1 glycosyltransferase family 2 protein [Saprospiraceae bacterium]HMX86144.1 glycosyltransferase family 2 protein [Saprospiraceae bacterium]
MQAISAVIITYNEERNIARCLESLLQVVDEIVVIDSYSTDRTEEICRQYGVRFISHEWEGYSGSKNFGNSQATHDLILSLDADEALSPALQKSILTIKNDESTFFYRIGRITNYCGHWIHHSGWYPDVKLRIFDRRISSWEGHIHEKLNNFNPKDAPLLKGDCFHYSYYTLEDHKAQARKFSMLAAEDLFWRGKRAGWFKILLSPVHKFIKIYLLQLGILDGIAGLRIAYISAHAVYLKYHTLKKLHASSK